MKAWRFFLLVLAAAVPDTGYSQVVINEVYYDHPGSDSGFEFIELYCPGWEDVPLTGWSIVMIDGRTGGVRELWAAGSGRVIERGGMILTGGDSCAVSPDDLLAGSIENGPDAVALLRGSEEIDLVWYGGDDPGCAAGSSLSRLPDGTALVCSSPTPGFRNFHYLDLSVSFDGPVHVHCISGWMEIPVQLKNRGLERYDGAVFLTVTSVQAHFRAVVGSRQAGLSLDKGEARQIRVTCSGLSSGISTLEIRIDADGDTDPGNDGESVTVSSSPGEVIINEIMYRPDKGGEWIELFNRSPGRVDLSGWSVTDRSGKSGLIAASVEIEPGSFLVIAQDPGGLSSVFPNFSGMVLTLDGGWPRLNDGDGSGTAEEIFIRRPDGDIVESAAYSSMVGDEKGRSIERLSPEMCSADRRGIWLRCGAAAGGTPGEWNYCHSGIIPAAGMIVTPDPFCPREDGMVRFTAAAGSGEAAYGAHIFNMDGREVMRLASGPVGAPAVSFTWDGRDSNGEMAGTGLYICVVEFMGSGGGVCRREKGTVAVWTGGR